MSAIRIEFTECRAVEREFRSQKEIANFFLEASGQTTSPIELKNSAEWNFAEGSLDQIEFSKATYHILHRRPRLRQQARDMISCMNRVGVLCCLHPEFYIAVALLEGRFVAYLWHHWRWYVFQRRKLQEGRARVFVPFENLVHQVSKVMLRHPLPIASERNEVSQQNLSAGDTSFWIALLNETSPIAQYYPRIAKSDP
tara:strand:+ start:218 stop:811 length:594 start_codon:yes stop_codon:yes gene_type:complete